MTKRKRRERTAGEGLTEWLERHNYDGLCNEGANCCCFLVGEDEDEGEEHCPRDCLVDECKAGREHTTDVTLRTIVSNEIPALLIEPPWEQVDE